ncbi:MAG: SDR family NAD(P)-dependent oxidoreductase, partial [Dehalococcoidales bacterium]
MLCLPCQDKGPERYGKGPAGAADGPGFSRKKRVKGKTVLITGANTGIGRATTLALAGMGAKIVMLCHTRERGQKAMEEIKEKSDNPDIDLL